MRIYALFEAGEQKNVYSMSKYYLILFGLHFAFVPHKISRMKRSTSELMHKSYISCVVFRFMLRKTRLRKHCVAYSTVQCTP